MIHRCDDGGWYPQELSTPVGNMGMIEKCEPFDVVVNWGALHRPRLRFDSAGEVGDLIEQTSTLGHQLTNLPVSMHNGRVIPAAECLPDLWK